MAEGGGAGRPGAIARFRRFLRDCKRIFKIAHKPTKRDYWIMMKICIVGFLILGGIAFIIHMVILIIEYATGGISS